MRSKNSPFPLEPTPLLPRNSIKSEEVEGNTREDLIRYTPEAGIGLRGKGELARLPRSPLREVGPLSASAQLRYFASSRPAILLTREQRRAAAADPALEWDASRHGYRLKRNE